MEREQVANTLLFPLDKALGAAVWGLERADLVPRVSGTFFAGSQSALLTLAGWGLTTLAAQQSGHPADVVAVETSLEYKLPLDGDLHIAATISEEDRDRFTQRLSRRGKATLRIHATGTASDGQVVCLYQGLYLART